MRRVVAAVVVSMLAGAAIKGQGQGPSGLGGSTFEAYLELLREQAGIPAISGTLVQDGRTVWEGGLGFANQEARIAASPATPYLVGGLTQSFSAVLLLRCAEERRIDLDEALREYDPSLPDASATVRQVLSHTSPPGAPGTFRYEPARFAQLAAVVERCQGQPFRRSVAEGLLDRLAMTDSVPGADMARGDAVPDDLFDGPARSRYARALEGLAVPYRVERRGRATPSSVPVDGINAATGLVSTVRDLARFDDALDEGDLLRAETLQQAWSPTRLPDGTAAPTGLGWFVQTFRGTPVVWQYGVVSNGYSALMIKVPSRQATMILLANSDGLAIPFELEQGDVTRSPFAALFLRMLL